ncbi:MAG: aspartate-semialdehyde dehydrogenase [Bacteroidetes bacterium]|nr:MAG: aspartate-semialdehyde dehydrogenase [Bacteroidota bacterium]
MKLAVVGVSGLVGGVILQVLEESSLSVDTLLPVASEKSVGKKVVFKGKEHSIISVEDAIANKPDIAIFSAGGETSLQYAERFAEVGSYVIDNSSAWRMDADKKLIIPEINADLLSREDKIIANPNCSTIQMLVPLAILHQAYGIKRIVISTYQSISGSGQKAINQYEAERKGDFSQAFYPHSIDANCLPHCDTFLDNGYTKEEMKLVNETHKILNDPKIQVSATAVRVPVTGGHSESVNVEFEKPFELEDVKKRLSESEAIALQDNPHQNEYPMPLKCKNDNRVFVGRIRKDLFLGNTLNMWIVADNLRKGAATNTVQIAEYIVAQGWVK